MYSMSYKNSCEVGSISRVIYNNTQSDFTTAGHGSCKFPGR